MRTISIPHGLHLALTWRYILVTIGALLLIAAAVLIIGARFLPPYASGMQPGVYMMQGLAEEAATYLEDDNRLGLAEWLHALRRPVLNLTLRDGWLRVNFAHFPDPQTQTLLIFEPEAGVLAAAPPSGPFHDITQIDDLPGPFDDALLTSLPPRPGANLVMTQNGSQSVTMMPVQRGDGTLLALLVLVNLATDAPPSWAAVLRTIGWSLLALTLAVGILGGTFGALASRFLVRRVDHLVETTASWGAGDFSQPVTGQTQPRDELDELGAHLNELRPRILDALFLGQQVAVQAERNRIARELHDSVKQHLFTLRMHLATAQAVSAEDAPAAPYLEQSVELAEDAQEEITALIGMFHRTETEQNQSAEEIRSTLCERLRQQAREWSKRTGITVDLLLPEQVHISAAVEHALLRIAGEALANVYKHSHARLVSIELKEQEDGIRLTVQDDGVGFDVEAISADGAGLGLRSMRERVEALGGHLRIRSDDSGTTVQVDV